MKPTTIFFQDQYQQWMPTAREWLAELEESTSDYTASVEATKWAVKRFDQVLVIALQVTETEAWPVTRDGEHG